MKNVKLFLLAGVAALSLASCANDEPVNVRSTDDNAISFRSGMSSRATETNNSNLSEIYVTAFTKTMTQPYFENIEFSKGSDSFFTSAEKYSWFANNDTITFKAYSPSQDVLGADITVSGDNMTLESFAVPEQIKDQVDFITATAKGNKKDNEQSGVELTFDHRLAQIEIRAKSSSPTYTYKVTGARIGRAQYMGSFDFNTNEWTLDDWHDTQVYTSACDEVTLTSEAQNIMGPDGNAMLLPQVLTPWSPTGDPDNVAREAYLSVLVQITRTDNGMQIYPYPSDPLDVDGNQRAITGKEQRHYAWASIPLSGEWKQGMKYIYTLDFTNGAGNIDPDDPNPGEPVIGDIKFKVTVNPWVDAEQATPMTPTF